MSVLAKAARQLKQGLGLCNLESALLMAICSAAGPLHAQQYPVRPLKLIIPFPPGGSTDLGGRLVAAEMSANLGQPVIVENKPGAAGTLGVDMVAKSAPDGYTMGLSGTGPTILAHLLGPKTAYALKDLAIVGNTGLVEFMIVARPGLPYASVREIVAAAKANPGKLSFASSGTPGHLAIEYLSSVAGIKLLHVPYKGDAPALNDVMGSQVDLGVLTIAVSLTQVRAGKAKGIAIASESRSPLLPDLPTVAESGVPGYEASAFTMLVVPAATPVASIERLNGALNAGLRKKELQDKFLSFGLVAVPGSAQAAAEVVRLDTEKWTRVIRDAKIQPQE